MKIAAGFLLIVSLCSAQGPSFDCTKASGEIEKLVCKDAVLASLDRKLAGVYAEAAKKQPDGKAPKWMVAEQRGWVKGRNDCWKDSDKRACAETEYTTRIAEIQAKNRLVKFNGPVTFHCGPSDELIATFHQTDPPSAVLERGDKSIFALISRSGSGAKYEGPNMMFWEKGGEAQVTWFGSELKCSARK